MLKELKKVVGRNLVNIPGWRTDRKIIVFESDDWGSNRIPSRKAYKNLLAEGIRVDRSLYDTFDTIEQREDLEYLFNILSSYKDINGNHPIFTFNSVMGNPAFDKIEQDQFEKYYHEDLETSYKRYNGDNIIDLWHSAMENALICPQFHAREHLNVSLWMEALRKNYSETKIAFDHRFYGLKANTPSPNQKNYLAAYWVENKPDLNNKINILKEGLEMFRTKFGFQSDSFVACNYIFPVEMEKPLLDFGVKYIQTQRGHISPNVRTGNKKINRHFTGQINIPNQLYLVRNCFFEPTLVQDMDPINNCINEIETAFRWKKPAIISTHRINYVGGMSIENRDKNLNKLEHLLTCIKKRWPEVEFMSTNKLGNIMESEI